MSTQNSLGYYSYPAPVGSVVPFAGRILPPTWLLCDGQQITSVDYPDLFNSIGNIYTADNITSGVINVDLFSNWEIITPTLASIPTVGQIIKIVGLFPDDPTLAVYATFASVTPNVGGTSSGTFTEPIDDVLAATGTYTTVSFNVPDLVNKAIFGTDANANIPVPAGISPSTYNITTANMPNFDVNVTDNSSFTAALGQVSYTADPQVPSIAEDAFLVPARTLIQVPIPPIYTYTATVASKDITYTNPNQIPIAPTITPTDPALPLAFANVLITYMIKAEY